MSRSILNWVILLLLTLVMINACCCIDQKKPAGEILFDGNTIHYEIYGSGEQTLLFIHGWSNNLHVWDEQINEFSELYRVVAVDLPGYGRSINDRDSWTMDSFGADVAAVISHLDLGNVILVGFSMGGPVSIETAKQIPQKVKGIVLVDILQNPDTKYSGELIESITTTYMDAVTYPTFEKIKPWFKTNQNELSQKYISMVNGVPKVGWKESLFNCLTWLTDSSVESIKSLKIPIVAINADQYPTDMPALRKYNSSFNARIIKGVYHVVQWEAPERFNLYLKESIQDIQSMSGKF